MMGGMGSNGGEIIQASAAPALSSTGDGERYRTADGVNWRRLPPFTPPAGTGEARGVIRGNRIYPVTY
jgi:hypothetical protein